jgi:hypothetical protein
VGTSFGTVRRNLSGTRTPPPPAPTPHRHSPAPAQSSHPRAQPPVPQPTVTVTATPAIQPRPHASPGPTVTLPGPVVVTHLRRQRPVADVSRSGGLVAGLWWSVLGAGLAGAGVVGGLYLRRRRLQHGGEA